jgi:hypothetical protein
MDIRRRREDVTLHLRAKSIHLNSFLRYIRDRTRADHCIDLVGLIAGWPGAARRSSAVSARPPEARGGAKAAALDDDGVFSLPVTNLFRNQARSSSRVRSTMSRQVAGSSRRDGPGQPMCHR